MTVFVHVIIQLNVSRRNHFTGVMKTRPRCLNHFNLLFLYPSGYASWSIDYPQTCFLMDGLSLNLLYEGQTMDVFYEGWTIPGCVHQGCHPDTWPEFVQGSAPPSIHLNQDRLHPLNRNTSPPHPARKLQGHHILCCGPLNWNRNTRQLQENTFQLYSTVRDINGSISQVYVWVFYNSCDCLTLSIILQQHIKQYFSIHVCNLKYFISECFM